MHTTFARTFALLSMKGEEMQEIFGYVNTIHNSFYHYLIYIHTTNIFILISFFVDARDAGSAPTNGPHTSTSRENGGIFASEGHISRRRIPFHLMPACNDLQVVR